MVIYKPGNLVAVVLDGQDFAALPFGTVIESSTDEAQYKAQLNNMVDWFEADKLISASTYNRIVEYMKDPNTRVYINHNNETGSWYYSVVVENSDAFWLNSFDTEQKALGFIKENGLKMSIATPFCG